MKPEIGTGNVDRVREPGDTWRLIAPHLSSYGITRLARLTGLDRIGVPVWNAVVPNTSSLAVNQGKGLSDLEARVSAAMEAIERAVAAAPEQPVLRSCAGALQREGRHCALLPELTAAHQADLSATTVTDWIAGCDLFTGEAMMLPFDAVTLDRTRTDLTFWQSSDGLAAGNSLAEARLHAVLERVERDAEALWYLGSLATRAATRFDPAGLADPVLDGLIRKIADAGLSAVFFDMTSDVGIPAVMVYLGPRDLDRRQPLPVTAVTAGSSAHPDGWRAAVKALLEAIQSRMTYISAARDDIDPALFDQPLAPSTAMLLEAPMAALPGWPDRPGGVTAQLTETISRVAAVGCSAMYGVSLAAPDRPFFVEKVIVPGLENPQGARKRPLGRRGIRRGLMS